MAGHVVSKKIYYWNRKIYYYYIELKHSNKSGWPAGWPPMRSFVTNILRIIVGIFILEPFIKRTNAKILLHHHCCSHIGDHEDNSYSATTIVLLVVYSMMIRIKTREAVHQGVGSQEKQD